MNNHQKQEAKKLYEEEEYIDSEMVARVFIFDSGDITPLDDLELEAGDRGYVSLAPVVYLVISETGEDEEDGSFEEIYLREVNSVSDVDENVVGAFVQLPSKKGDSHLVDRPQILNSEEEVIEFMEKWRME